MGTRPELELLHLFVAAAESVSFSAAAKQLALPKSTVSRGIARLEESLGAQLFLRTTHRVGLTPTGRALFQRVHPAVAALREAVSSLPEQREVPTGELKITACGDIAEAWFADIVSRFSLRYPELRVSLRLTTTQVDLVREGFDVAVRISGAPLKDSTLVARRVATFSLGLYTSPAYVARCGLPQSVRNFDHHDWVSPPGLHKFLKLPVPPSRERIVADDFLVVRRLLRGGSGVGALPSFLVGNDVTSGALVRVLPDWSAPKAQVFLVHAQARHVPLKIRVFRDFVVKQLATKTGASPL